jgi:hypothetical protein
MYRRVPALALAYRMVQGNDVWFGHSAAPHQHNLMSVMRAVENRVPIVIASNTGPSQIIDGYGRVVASVPGMFTDGLATGTMHTETTGTLYSAVGDVFVLAVLTWLSASFAWRSVTGLWAREPRSLAWLPNGWGSTGMLKKDVTVARVQMKNDGGVS